MEELARYIYETCRTMVEYALIDRGKNYNIYYAPVKNYFIVNTFVGNVKITNGTVTGKIVVQSSNTGSQYPFILPLVFSNGVEYMEDESFDNNTTTVVSGSYQSNANMFPKLQTSSFRHSFLVTRPLSSFSFEGFLIDWYALARGTDLLLQERTETFSLSQANRDFIEEATSVAFDKIINAMEMKHKAIIGPPILTYIINQNYYNEYKQLAANFDEFFRSQFGYMNTYNIL